MKDYTLMLIGDERSPVRRFLLPQRLLQRALVIAVALGIAFLAGIWDYWRLRADNAELGSLRIEAAEQRERIEIFGRTLATVESELARVQELERKVRVIANLPGAAATGGEGVAELAPGPNGRARKNAGDGVLMPPVGVPVERGVASPDGPDAPALKRTDQPPAVLQGQGGAQVEIQSLIDEGLQSAGGRRLHLMNGGAQQLGGVASLRAGSLEELVVQLEDKRSKLASMPSIWPARGWLTSGYGYRISPFTGRRHLHPGLDIAAEPGTAVFAPARGRVRFVGRKGPLGNTVVIDHGYGVRTLYGHNSELHVKIGEQVVRGQQIASVGSTGRSTGPHLHYVVEVNFD
jgi:murein DD-endopeptidase MepM/ murein hydrolase activator NlpD